MTIIVSVLVNALAVFASGYILSGIHLDSFVTAIVVAIVLGVLNAFVKPILVLLSLPLTILTFGLFTFVINALIILIVDTLVPGFNVDGFLWALIFAVVLAIISSFLNSLIK